VLFYLMTEIKSVFVRVEGPELQANPFECKQSASECKENRSMCKQNPLKCKQKQFTKKSLVNRL
jgi:hypothetical protein